MLLTIGTRLIRMWYKPSKYLTKAIRISLHITIKPSGCHSHKNFWLIRIASSLSGYHSHALKNPSGYEGTHPDVYKLITQKRTITETLFWNKSNQNYTILKEILGNQIPINMKQHRGWFKENIWLNRYKEIIHNLLMHWLYAHIYTYLLAVNINLRT